ncbi:DUF1659 domain-containing protein [Alicyclobacillus cycloheptanicus]|jgi:hypothetical protein|uniref:DUF1659 domain-containing protein n=1 Tax=Alicyclobacillus cycloheptanicus TaxID=1457 RepID=A0ABT9XIN9_9BACL|nr:DUF1659 domain-containing protein [Alicyclobacillus cycloheptanicus]MDQ0190067.1 hypothetical protein [Alicyclobacillus cycloheptanicus]WDM02047.1 DUF1659 domain-containing protein [Alicyclobacillus cycloheptanicus]
MATITPLSRHLQLQFQNGTLASGKPKVKNQSYTNVSPSAADDDILAVGQALAALSSETLLGIARLDQSGLAAAAATASNTGASGAAGGASSNA